MDGERAVVNDVYVKYLLFTWQSINCVVSLSQVKSLGIECVLSQIQVYIMFVGMQFAVYIVFTLVVLPCYVACKTSLHSLRLPFVVYDLLRKHEDLHID